jgi:hypothetical protein
VKLFNQALHARFIEAGNLCRDELAHLVLGPSCGPWANLHRLGERAPCDVFIVGATAPATPLQHLRQPNELHYIS